MRPKPTAGVPKAVINITPYIDILLVLLIIFMVIQPTTEYQLGARAPAKPGGGAAIQAAPVVISIDMSGALAINSQPIAFPQLGDRLFGILSERADKRIFVLGDRELPFGTIARVIDIAKGAGAGDVGLI